VDEAAETKVFFKEPVDSQSGVTLSKEWLHSGEFKVSLVPSSESIDSSVFAQLTDQPCPECGMFLDRHSISEQSLERKGLLRRDTPVVLSSLVCPECGWTGQ
jgi:hypothetical protein